MERRPVIVAGFGFRAAAGLDALRAALATAQHGCPPVEILAVPQDKIALVQALADLLAADRVAARAGGCPLTVIGVSPAALQAMRTPTRSIASIRHRATGSVAEAAALAAAGPGAVLLTSRHISADRMATCAIARGTCRGHNA
ncbi:cobalamin biosynthesis protein [Sphingomonas sp. Leaf20]|uniref:cobalamin biosynthesis protein n=1 Tax=Sphingomonas sp. Leaf20 TaxID=1735685 RepID=UPI001F21B967|nr:cobalamin biosynthesis protein [Sphingomonas sp. Leaf20]